MTDKPWRDAETLYELYVEKQLPQREIADKLGCTQKTVMRNLKENDITARSEGRQVKYPKLKNKDWLYEQYYEEDRTCKEIADELGTYSGRVSQWLEKHDISPTEHPHVGFNDGYTVIQTREAGKLHHVSVHRLTAVAWFGLDEVVGKEVHHKNGVRWDNREQNLEPLTVSEHRSLHAKERWDDES